MGDGDVSFETRSDVSLIRRLDSWITWGVAGAAIGFALGVNTASVVLVAIGLGGFVVYLKMHDPPNQDREGSLFAAGSVFMIAWLVGFIIRGLIF